MPSKKIIFLSENPPLKTKGSGISVLLYNILRALGTDHSLNVITFNKAQTASVEEIRSDNEGVEVRVVDRFCGPLYRRARSHKRQLVVEFAAFAVQWPWLVLKHNRRGSTIITLVGASIQPVVKAWFLMTLLPRARHILYIVDDLELINRKYGNRLEMSLTATFLGRAIRKADSLLTISDGLGALYRRTFQKESSVLLPHYQKTDKLVSAPGVPAKADFTFLFTGGLNILYNDSLQCFGAALARMNRSPARAMTFRLQVQTYSPRSDFDSLGLDASCVSYSTAGSRQDLAKVYAGCDGFVIPYSFAAENHDLVTTSFPQKLAEIIQYGKKILVFAPEYSSLARFFSQNELAHRCNQEAFEALEQSILQLVDGRDDVAAYDGAYARHLSAENVRRVMADATR